MSAITVDGDLVHYEVLGRGGRPVVLLHGWLGSWRYWIPTMRQLQLKYRVYALDLFGYGDSGKNPAKYSLQSQVRLLEEFMLQLGIPKVALIAHGYGTQVAINYASHHPDRVARMMLSSTPLFDPGDLATRVPPVRLQALTTPNVVNTFDKTVPAGSSASRPAPVGVEEDSAATLPSALRETIRNPNTINREALKRAAAYLAEQRKAAEDGQQESVSVQSAIPPAPQLPPLPSDYDDTDNQLRKYLTAEPEALLNICFKKTEPEYEKLQQDIAKGDNKALEIATRGYDAGHMVDALRVLPMPIMMLHGEQDPLLPAPSEAIWDYITEDKEDQLVPIPLANVRHFPMLEYESFQRLIGQFLEQPDISKIETKERWRRRSR